MGAGLLRLFVGDRIDRRTRPYKFDAIFYHPYFTMLVGAGSPKYLTPIDNPKNPPPPHPKINNLLILKFEKSRSHLSVGKGGFIKIIGGWQERSANPPLQMLFTIALKPTPYHTGNAE
ncbi:MAG: hypothetical protein EAZ78_24985 [Oscillatoriales cyanobacterium]|nr:MAG: hypothetical protein EAZ78_24985 [Oscillatoriales cyanobacterium]